MKNYSKSQKGFIQIPILIAIIVAVSVIGGGAYFGVKQYQNYRAEKIEQKKQTELNQKTEEEQRQKLQGLLNSQSEELEKQKSEIEALKNKKPETITQTIIKEAPAQKTENDLASIIEKWKPLVAYIKCDFFYKDNTYSHSQSGSGTLFEFSDGIGIQTNKHVISEELPLTGGLATPDYCTVKFLGNDKLYYVYHHTESGVLNLQTAGDGSDGGRLIIRETDNFIMNLSLQRGAYCERKPSLGESIIILGYPSISSAVDITATEGIISSYEYSVNSGNYYITSAKIEHGNSGGAAILVKDNCYLGIPTFAQVGEIESLSRILDEPGLLK